MPRVYLFVSLDLGRGIGVYQRGKDGSLHLVQELPIGGRVVPMALSADARFLYAAVRGDSFEIVTLAVDPATARLSLLSRALALESAAYLSIDGSGRHLLAAFNVAGPVRSGMVASYPIRPDGTVQDAPVMIRTRPKAHAILTDAANRFALAAICNGDVIQRFHFDPATGDLSEDGLAQVIIRPGSGPRHMRFSPDGRHFYLMNEYDASIVVFRWTAETGALQEVQTVEGATPGQEPQADWHGGWRGADICLTPDGLLLYVSVRNSSTIAWFHVDVASGRLTRAGQIDTAREPRGLAMDPSGRFLFASGMEENVLTSFAIASGTGALSAVGQVDTGKGPNWIEIAQLA